MLENIIHSFPAKSSSSVDAPYPCSNHAVSSGFLTEKLGFTDLSTSAEIQEYFLLGGMCYIALQRWEDAQIFLEHVLVTPTQGVPTGMMLEAYRKWLLVGCLASGQAPKPPKLINQTALKDMRATSPHYISLSEVFVSANPTRLAGEMYEGVTHWSEDGNTGLVQQLPDYLRRFYVATLEKTYSAIPVTAVAGWLCQPPDEAQQYLEDLIQEGHLNARIEPSSNGSQWPILRFFTDPSTGPRVKSEADQLLNVQRQAQRTNLLAEYVRDADRKLAITKEYIQKLMSKDSEKRAAEALASQGVFDPAVMDMMDTSAAMGGIGDGEDDEDLMEEFH